MSIEERYSYLRRMHERYLAARRRERSGLLDEILAQPGQCTPMTSMQSESVFTMAQDR